MQVCPPEHGGHHATQDFATTKKFYAANRAAQSAAAEIHEQLGSDVDLNALVGG
jgi:hypothetical protein